MKEETMSDYPLRTADKIIDGDALTWATMGIEQLRYEHEVLRRHAETQRRQIAALVRKSTKP